MARCTFARQSRLRIKSPDDSALKRFNKIILSIGCSRVNVS